MNEEARSFLMCKLGGEGGFQGGNAKNLDSSKVKSSFSLTNSVKLYSFLSHLLTNCLSPVFFFFSFLFFLAKDCDNDYTINK
jgi:hypothetical protein